VADTQTALAVFCEGDYLLYQNRNAGNHAVSVHLQKFKGQEMKA
jgi:hypothetical protein